MRKDIVTEQNLLNLMQHASEEMGYLAELLPVLYRQITGDTTF